MPTTSLRFWTHKHLTLSIVFVHGLRETGLKAWTDAATGILWMRDLFPHSKYAARGLVYEYDAERLIAPGGLAANGIYDEAVSLVNHLVAERELQDAEQRPMIFICHEFGGILVKRALAYSHSRNGVKLAHVRSIYRSNFAIIFMATPHQGFRKDTLLLLHQDRNSGPSQFMLSLLEGSETLHEVTDQFAPLMKHFFIYNFWEQIRTTFGQTSVFLVDRTSAAPSWDDVDQCGINATHSEMVKFKSRTSPGYRIVLAALEQYIKLAPNTTAKRWEQDSKIIQKEREHEVEILLPTSLPCLKGQSQAPPTTAAPAESPSRSLSSKSSTSGTDSMAFECATSEGTATPPNVNVHYLVRPRSDYFFGRQHQAELLQKQLGAIKPKAGKKPKVFVIYGLPGAGKSQFCLRYLEERQHESVPSNICSPLYLADLKADIGVSSGSTARRRQLLKMDLPYWVSVLARGLSPGLAKHGYPRRPIPGSWYLTTPIIQIWTCPGSSPLLAMDTSSSPPGTPEHSYIIPSGPFSLEAWIRRRPSLCCLDWRTQIGNRTKQHSTTESMPDLLPPSLATWLWL